MYHSYAFVIISNPHRFINIIFRFKSMPRLIRFIDHIHTIKTNKTMAKCIDKRLDPCLVPIGQWFHAYGACDRLLGQGISCTFVLAVIRRYFVKSVHARVTWPQLDWVLHNSHYHANDLRWLFASCATCPVTLQCNAVSANEHRTCIVTS